METDQLLEVIESGETQEVELKQSFHSSQDFSKLMCGFANTQGGMIIVGVNAKKTIIGTKEDVDELPDGRKMTKSCFWLNAKYLKEQIANN